MIKLGITGGIGSGKSFVAGIIRKLGFPVYDCDTEARRLMTEDQEVRSRLEALLGSNLYASGGLDRQLMAEYLFAGEANARRVDGIVHPAVRSDFARWATAQNSLLVGLESAILFESGFGDAVDKVLLVSSPEVVRIMRVMERDKVTQEQVRARMARQMSDAERRRLSDFEIVNDGLVAEEFLMSEARSVLLACGVPLDCISEGPNTADDVETPVPDW